MRQRRTLRGRSGRRRSVEPVLEDRGDRAAGQRADLDRAGAGRLHPDGVQTTEQPQDAEAGAEPLLWMRPPGHYGDDQRLGGDADAARVTLQALRRPLGIAPMRARHVLCLGAVTRAAMAPGVRRDALAAVEHLDRALRRPGVDLLADQRMRHRVEKALHLNVVVDADAGQMPLGILEIVLRQRSHHRTLDRLEQLGAAHADAAHLAVVHPLHRHGDGGVALRQGKERHVAQAADDVGLGEAHPRLHGGLVARAPRPGRQDADAIVRRHRAIAAVHLRVVERRLVHSALEVVRHQQPRRHAPEPEHADAGANPVRERLRPARLSIGQAGRPQHGDEDLRRAHRARDRVGDRHQLAGIIHERLVPRGVLLAHLGDSRRSIARNSWQNRQGNRVNEIMP